STCSPGCRKVDLEYATLLLRECRVWRKHRSEQPRRRKPAKMSVHPFLPAFAKPRSNLLRGSSPSSCKVSMRLTYHVSRDDVIPSVAGAARILAIGGGEHFFVVPLSRLSGNLR